MKTGYFFIYFILISNIINLIESRDEIKYFVDLKNGLDSNEGSMNKPFRHFDYAIDFIKELKNENNDKFSVVVSSGVYNIRSTISLGNKAISIYGGYSGFPDWKREFLFEIPYKSSTIIKCKKSMGFNITENSENITLSHLTIYSQDAITPSSLSDNNQKTLSSFGILISRCKNVKLKFLYIESGDGADPYKKKKKSNKVRGGSSIGVYIYSSNSTSIEFSNLVSGTGAIGGVSVSLMSVQGMNNQKICNSFTSKSDLEINGYIPCLPSQLNCSLTPPLINDCIDLLSVVNSHTVCEFGELRDSCGICGGNGSLCKSNIGCDDILYSGKAYDLCGVCDGTNSTCLIGCDGIVNSTLVLDACQVCGGNNSTCLIGCDGIANSKLVYDNCQVCGGDNSSCLIGCDGIVNSTLFFDACQVCGGDNSSCLIGCDGIVNSTLVYDECEVCGGDNSTCLIGCDGIEHSYKTVDACGICGGDSTSCVPEKELRKMKSSTKIVISLAIIGGSLYGTIMAVFYICRKLKDSNIDISNVFNGSGGSNDGGSQYYRTKLILEYEDSPFVQAELIKKSNHQHQQNPQNHNINNNINNIPQWSSLSNNFFSNLANDNSNRYSQGEVDEELNLSTSSMSYPTINE